MKRYQVVVADPPWFFKDRLTMSDVKRGAASHYATMSDAMIADLAIGKLAAEDSLCALWCPSSKIDVGLFVLRSWGFAFKTVYTWAKTTKSGGLACGLGHTFRGTTEHALIGKRGRPVRVNKSQRNFELSPALPHSAKPDTLQERLALMYQAGPWLELFARRDLRGWTCTGLECPSTEGQDIRAWIARRLKK